MDDMNLTLDEIIRKKRIKQSNAQAAVNGSDFASKGNKQSLKGMRITHENTVNARKSKPILDARLKIIQKKRAKIRDARDKLVEIARTSGDARLRLNKKVNGSGRGLPQRPLSALSTNGGDGGSGQLKVQLRLREMKNLSKTRKMQKLQPSLLPKYRPSRGLSVLQYEMMDVDDNDEAVMGNINHEQDERLILGGKHYGNRQPGSAINTTRVLYNDAYSMPNTMPPLPRFRTVRSTASISTTSPSQLNHGTSMMNYTAKPSCSSDPFDHYEMPPRPNLSVPPPLSYEPVGSISRPLRGILRTRSDSSPPLPSSTASHISITQPHLSPSMRARLERVPNPNESMGIFARMPPDDYHYVKSSGPLGHSSSAVLIPTYRVRSSPPLLPSIVGYRIVVSNLHNSVTQLDIKELFEDIGDLLESRLVRPGVAEVIYRTLKDAEKAVDAYHNRQLDGQPMNCLLVNPRASNKPTAPAMKYGK